MCLSEYKWSKIMLKSDIPIKVNGPNTVSSAVMVQFHRLPWNWYWHSSIPLRTPALTVGMWSLWWRHILRCPGVRPRSLAQNLDFSEKRPGWLDHFSNSWRPILLERGIIIWIFLSETRTNKSMYHSIFNEKIGKL